jgi:hypothetical protein
MNHSRTKTLLIIASAITLVGMLLSGFIIYLIYEKEGKMADVEAKLAVAQAAADSGVSMNHLLTDTKPEREKLDTYFIGSDNVVSFIERIESLSTITKVTTAINSVGIDKSTTDNTFEYVTLNGTAEGSFSNVYWFLSLLESIPLQITVDQIYIEQMPVTEKNAPTKWRATFTLKALKLK